MSNNNNPLEDLERAAREVGNVINDVGDRVQNEVRRAVTSQNNYSRVTYNGSGNGRRPYNYDPQTGKPLNNNGQPEQNVQYVQNVPPAGSQTPKTKQKKFPLWPFIVAGVVLFVSLPVDGMISLAIGAGVCVGGFFLGKGISGKLAEKKAEKERKKYQEELEQAERNAELKAQAEAAAKKAAEEAAKKEAEAQKRAAMAVKRTGDPELDKVIDEGNEYIIALREANEAIPGEGISSSIDRIEKACRGIFEYIRSNKTKLPEIKKFMNYYLPTTLKLLNSYEKLDSQAVKGETITNTMFDIEGMMVTIASAFEKKLDQLFESDSMDIQADIEVFENLLNSEGLTDDGNNITLKL